jgi:hypothetical protein
VAFKVKEKETKTVYEIICPFDESHNDGCACIMQSRDGIPAAKCHHASCADKKWAEFKEAIGKPDRDHYDPPLPVRSGGAATGEPEKPYRPLDPFRPFPVQALPEPLRSYVAESAASIGCDPAFIAVPMMAVLGAAVGNSRRIELKHKWSESAVIWATPISPTGTLKSPGLDAALAPVRMLQDAKVAQWRDEKKEYAQQDSEGEGEGRGRGEPPECSRIVTSDCTVEALALLLQKNLRGLLVARDELNGWLGGMDAYKRGRGGDVSHYLEMFRAGQLIIDRKTGGEPLIHVRHAGVCVVGTTHPETFIQALGRQHFEDGLLPRFLTALPPRTPRQWTDRVVAAEVAAAYFQTIRRLYQLAMLQTTEDGDPEPEILTFSPEGKEAWVPFFNRHAEEQNALFGDLAGAWSKLEGYAARLALVLELARWAGKPAPRTEKNGRLVDRLTGKMTPSTISAWAVESAATLIAWFGAEAKRVYALLTDEENDREGHYLVSWVKSRGGAVTVRDLYTSGHRKYRGRREDAEKALQNLVDGGMGTWEVQPPSPTGGHTVRIFRLALESLAPQNPRNTSE